MRQQELLVLYIMLHCISLPNALHSQITIDSLLVATLVGGGTLSLGGSSFGTSADSQRKRGDGWGMYGILCQLDFLSLVELLRHSIFEHDREVIQCFFPFWNWHRPFLGGFVDRHVYQLQRRITIRILFTVACELANHAVDGLNHISRVDRFANLCFQSRPPHARTS